MQVHYLRTTTNVRLDDTFWLKTHNYALYDILDGNDSRSLAPEDAPNPVGGSAYQAFLAPRTIIVGAALSQCLSQPSV